MKMCFLLFLPLCLLWVPLDAVLLCQHYQKLLHAIAPLHQLMLKVLDFSGELLCLILDLLNGGLGGGGEKGGEARGGGGGRGREGIDRKEREWVFEKAQYDYHTKYGSTTTSFGYSPSKYEIIKGDSLEQYVATHNSENGKFSELEFVLNADCYIRR